MCLYKHKGMTKYLTFLGDHIPLDATHFCGHLTKNCIVGSLALEWAQISSWGTYIDLTPAKNLKGVVLVGNFSCQLPSGVGWVLDCRTNITEAQRGYRALDPVIEILPELFGLGLTAHLRTWRNGSCLVCRT